MSKRGIDVIDIERARTLDGLFRERVRRSPEAPAYRSYSKAAQAWETVTWGEAGAQVARWSAALAAEGVQPGDRVALALRNCAEWVYFDQAALRLGLVVVPLYTDDRPDNVAYILQNAGAKVLLVADSGAWRRLSTTAEELPELKRILLLGESRRPVGEASVDERIRLVDDWLPQQASEVSGWKGDPDALASIVYTSGTTGRPKGVMLSHRNMLSIANAVLDIMHCYQDDVFLSFLPLSHTLERTGGYYLPMMAGATVAYARSVLQLAEDLQQVRPTLLIAVPRIFERFFARVQQQLAKQSRAHRQLFNLAVAVGWRRFEHQQGRAAWSPALLLWPGLEKLVARKVTARLGGRLRLAVSGGAALGMPVARLFIGLGVTLLQGYGLTETSPVISVNRPHDNDPGGVGRPLPGVQVSTGDDDELLVKSPGVMLGYWNDPAATSAILNSDGWLRTGDQVTIRDGHIHITGRIKDILVLSNGEKVPPGDMENAITLDALFDQVMLIGEGRPFLSALAVLSGEAWPAFATELGLDPSERASLKDSRVASAVLTRIAARLKGFPGYAKVRRVILSLDPWTLDNGLLTPTLKVKRKQVLARFEDEVERIYEEGPAGARQRVA
ncbi:MAG: long-chain fatty acid--CoA ligase [Gammaproteobacteria bacterium]|nr:long-chain fatty acid--CoA ligase [Gammaproteobacteria bacterium]